MRIMIWLLLISLCTPLIAGDTIHIGPHSYDVSQLRVDNVRVEVNALPEYSAVLFNFSIYHHDGHRRRPLVGIQKSDLHINLADEHHAISATEASYDVVMLEGHAETLVSKEAAGKVTAEQEEVAAKAWRQRMRPTLLRYIVMLLDMSESMFKESGRLQITRNVVKALLDSLVEAKLPGVLVAVYAFADVDSLQLVCDYSSDIAKVRRAVDEELNMSEEERNIKYGVATDLFLSTLATLEAVEGTLKASPSQAALANVFIVTDGNDETRIITADAFNIRLSRLYLAWTQSGLDIIVQPVLLSGLSMDQSLGRVQFNGERIDAKSTSTMTTSFQKIVADIAENTPASYSVLVCETARDTAPRQRRDLMLQGHRILSYDFSPAGFSRQGAAKCDASALLARLTEFGELESALDGNVAFDGQEL